jgi:hypothetical protein
MYFRGRGGMSGRSGRSGGNSISAIFPSRALNQMARIEWKQSLVNTLLEVPPCGQGEPPTIAGRWPLDFTILLSTERASDQ